MFQSATLKLTGWYLMIIVIICLLFSIVIYAIASKEVGSRINYMPNDPGILRILDQQSLNLLRARQIEAAEQNLIYSLLITNIVIWGLGGVGSYYLARRSLEPIERAHEAQSRFTSDASHELRTPLASMKTELEVALRDPALTKGEMQELLTSNLEEVNKLTNLSQTLLQLSRLEHDDIERGSVDLRAVLSTVLPRFGKDAARVKVSTHPQARVLANISAAEELFTILIDNALKYSPPESTVKLKFVRSKLMAGFEITNKGSGIPATLLPRIFDRFFRVDNARSGGARRSYGLGLSLAKKLVEVHGGELSVTSRENGPTTFQVLLPLMTK
jgi:signal transduction histidine kinase